MRHLIWIIIHYLMYLAIPDFGASISLLAFLLLNVFRTFYFNRNLDYLNIYYLGMVLTIAANLKIISAFKYQDGVIAYTYAIPEFFGISALIIAIGNQMLALGYGLKMGFEIPKINLQVSLSTSNLDKMFFIGILFAFQNFWSIFSLPGSLQTIIDVIPTIAIFILARFAGKFNIQKLYIQALILTVAAVLNALLFAYLRLEMVLPVMVFMLGYFIGAKSLKSFFSLKFIPVIWLGILFYSFFSFFGEKRSNLSMGWDRLSQITTSLGDGDIADLDEDEKLTAFERASNVAQVSAVVGLVESRGYYNGLASGPLVAAFVPRIFWPDKPIIALGVWFAVEIGAAIQVDEWFNNSINMTIPGNLFIDFGWPGLVIGSLIIGFLLRLLWDSSGFYNKKFNLLGTFFGVYLLFTAFLGIGADMQILITYIAIYLVMLFLSKVFKRTDENSMRRANLARK